MKLSIKLISLHNQDSFPLRVLSRKVFPAYGNPDKIPGSTISVRVTKLVYEKIIVLCCSEFGKGLVMATSCYAFVCWRYDKWILFGHSEIDTG